MKSKVPKILIIGYVWPEPTSSAAGLRDQNLVDLFQREGWEIYFLSPAKENEYSSAIAKRKIPTLSIPPNDPKFDLLVKEIDPDFVVFDRFVTEEQFGWRVQQTVPNAIRILDTQDLHFLRRARKAALDEGVSLDQIFDCDIKLNTEVFQREIGSIYRSDLSLILSDFEKDLLHSKFGVSEHLMCLFRFCYPKPPKPRSFEDRCDFTMIGNFRHPPNMDGIFWLHKEIWPLIRKKLPQAQVHIYGAYPPKEATQLNDPSLGFHIKGWARDQMETLGQYRINLAPLRFGAGIKGKVSDGWWAGTPVVTTPIGSEGMTDGLPFGGLIGRNPEQFAEMAALLHDDKELWTKSQSNGRLILNKLYNEKLNGEGLMERLCRLKDGIQTVRNQNIVGSVLWYHGNKSTKYFSKWIELKNQTNSHTKLD